MKLIKLDRPMCVLDLETTGLDVLHDQIFQIGIWKIQPDSSGTYKEWNIKPSVQMSSEASEKTGVKDADLADFESFEYYVEDIIQYIIGCDFAGFNSDRFDIPMLMEEIARAKADFDFQGVKTIDVMKIFHLMNKRDLNAASIQYLGEPIVDSHTSKADVFATGKILMNMLEKHPEIGDSMDTISKEYSYRGDWADFTGHLSYNDMKELVFNFGKLKGQTVESVATTDPGYLSWIAGADFSNYTKKLIRDVLTKIQK